MATVLLAGCSNPETVAGDTPVGEDGEPIGAVGETWNYTTMHPAGEAFTKTYEGRLSADEAANNNGIPLGATVYGTPAEFCCQYDFIDVPDLLQPEQLLGLRLTLTWTNTPTDHAGFDVATCLPGHCHDFNYGADESNQQGEHVDTFTLLTAATPQYTAPPQIGVRYTNAVLTSGLDYSIAVEAVPAGDAIGFYDPYTINIAENSSLTVEVFGPFSGEIGVGLMFYDEDDRPFHYHSMTGVHGARFNLSLPAGELVVFSYTSAGFLRFSTDVEPEQLRLERLEEEFGVEEVATVPDAQAHSGTATYEAPPGSLDLFPIFAYGDGVSAQVDPQAWSRITMASSSGTIADVQLQQVGAQAAGQNHASCMTCAFMVPTLEPGNYVDDDGVYDLEWSSQGAAGTFVVYTGRYLR